MRPNRRLVGMSNHKNEFLDLHFAAVAGTVLNSRPHQGPASRDAEPTGRRGREDRREPPGVHGQPKACRSAGTSAASAEPG